MQQAGMSEANDATDSFLSVTAKLVTQMPTELKRRIGLYTKSKLMNCILASAMPSNQSSASRRRMW